MRNKYNFLTSIFFLFLCQCVFFGEIAWAQELLAPGNQIIQNFDSLKFENNAALPPNWKADHLLGLRQLGSYPTASDSTTSKAGNNMASNARSGIYNFGAGEASEAEDRALGFLVSDEGGASGNLYVSMRNSSATSVINALVLSYDIEKYRQGTNPAGFSITLYYSKNGGPWTSAGPDFTVAFPPDPVTQGYPAAPGEVKAVSNKLLILPDTHALAPGDTLYLAWNYSLSPGAGTSTANAQALGIDNVVISAPSESNTTITKPMVTGAPFSLESCNATATGAASFDTTGTYGGDNQFTVQLSDKQGNFTNPLTIGQGAGKEVPFTIPAALLAGEGYKIRVHSSNPIAISEPSDPFSINTASTYYRSMQSGLWHEVSTWESSTDKVTWTPATSIPDASAWGITIKSGDTVTITQDLTVNQLLIEDGAILNRNGGSLTVSNTGCGDYNIIVRGTYVFSGGSTTAYEPGSKIRVVLGGTVEVRSNTLTSGTAPEALPPVHHGTSENYLYESGATFYWNVPDNISIDMTDKVFFPNLLAVTPQVPVLRINGILNLDNSTDALTINGITQVEGGSTLVLQNVGTKTLRNGITGDGNVVQASDAGKLLISGATAQIGGAGVITLGINGLDIINNSQVQLLNNKTIESGTLTVVAGVLNTQTFSIAGTAGFTLNDQGTLQTSHPEGIGGALNLSGPKSFGSSASYIFSTLGIQSTNFPAEVTGVGNLTINNSNDLGSGIGTTSLNRDLVVNGQVAVTGILDVATFSLSGPGNFRLNANGTIKTSHLNGIAGSIQLGGIQEYHSAANYFFAGDSEQSTGFPEQLTSANDFIVDKPAGVLLLNKSLVVNTVASVTGNLNIGSFSLTGPGSFSLTGNSTLITAHAEGVGGSVQMADMQFDPSAAYAFTGEVEQTTGFPVNVETASKLRINKSAGNLILNKALTLSDSLNLLSGKLITSSQNMLMMGPGTKVANASAASFVEGPMSKRGSESFIFPIGKDTVYAPLGIVDPGTETSTYKAEYFTASAPDTVNKEETIIRLSQVEHWVFNKLSDEPINANFKVTLYWRNGSRSGIENPISLRVAHYNPNGGGIWEDMGNGHVEGSAEAGSITSAREFKVNGPVTFASSDETNPLPVTLLSFTGKYQNGAAVLQWSTASERNNMGFEIEKSADGVNFHKIGFIEGNRNSQVKREYTFTDLDFQYDTYYRLKQLDIDGKFEYSDLVLVRRQNLGGLSFRLSPNPVDDRVELVSDCCDHVQQLTVRLVASDGRTIGTFTGNMSGINSYLNNQLSGFKAGVYHLYIQSPAESVVLKLVKN